MARRKRLIPPTPFSDAPEASVAEAPASGQGKVSAAPMAPVARVAQEQAQAAALWELAEEMTRAREDGRIVLELPLEAVDAKYLIRDRISTDETEMQSLKESLAASGQRNPVEVLDLGGGRYGLISGWRRLTALRALSQEGRAGGTILALLRHPEDQAAAYRAMVEENEIRADLSYYERARIVAKAVEAGVFKDDRDALQGLFGAASRPRRSKIGSFLPIVRALDGALRHPSTMPERLGLKLSQCLREDDALARRLCVDLSELPDDPKAERSLLERTVTPAKRPLLAEALDPAQVKLRVGRGKLVLEGSGVTPELVRKLEAWLARQPELSVARTKPR